MMKKIQQHIIFFFLLLVAIDSMSNDFTVGIGRKIITPEAPAWLSGYASRTKPADKVIHDLWAKAVAIRGNGKEIVVIVSTDLLGLTHEVAEDVAAAVFKKHRINRSSIMFNSSHTHSGPMVWPGLSVIADYDMANQKVVSAYSHTLTTHLVDVIDMALGNMKPMKISTGKGYVDFAKNRRKPTEKGIVNALNPDGPVDHDVPVIKIENTNGNVEAILFLYACHNTTVTGANNSINGDYAGFAQLELERKFPRATAMFIMGCGGDQNPYPRGTVEIAQQHGEALAGEITKVVNGKLKILEPLVSAAITTVDLQFKPADIRVFQQDMTGDDVFRQRRASLMLEAYNKGWDVSTYPYPVQAIRLSKDLLILALAGEVVIDYALNAKKKYKNENLLVAGYSNEVMCYIPNERILEEGGYEANESMIYYGMQGPFQKNVQLKIEQAIDEVIRITQTDSVMVRNKEVLGAMGTYAAPPLKKNGRADIKKLVKQLKDQYANTYNWLIWKNKNDWDDLKLFLPEARKAGIKVWVTLVPPSESRPVFPWSSDPFGMDYQLWAAELARLSLKETNLVAWSIDDFVHNLQFFTPEYTGIMVDSARSINPQLAFIPCCYYRQITPAFADNYGRFIDGILFPYRAESVKPDLSNSSAVENEIEHLRQMFRKGLPVFLDVYATGHSRLGESSSEYVSEVTEAGLRSADGVLIYCHQNPETSADKYQRIREAFKNQRK